MAFPTTPELDNLTRADEDPLSDGGKWSALSSSQPPLRLVSNQAARATGTVYSWSYRNDQTYGPDCEVWATIGAALVNDDFMMIGLRVQQAGGADTFDGYFLNIGGVTGGIDELYVERVLNSVDTQLGANIEQTIGVGDSVGLSAIGTTLEVWYKASGGSWVSLGTRTDSTYAGAGHIALAILGLAGNTSMRWSAFGGGSIVTTSGQTGYLKGNRLRPAVFSPGLAR